MWQLFPVAARVAALIFVAGLMLIFADQAAFAGTMIVGTAAAPPIAGLNTIDVEFVDTQNTVAVGSDIDVADSYVSAGGVTLTADGNPVITGPNTPGNGIGSATWTLPTGMTFDVGTAYSWTLYFTSDEVSIQSTYWFYDKTVSDTDLFVQVYYGPDGDPRGYPVGIGFHDTVSAATPLPTSLPLFATGLGAMGLFGWRRKRKNADASAV